MKYKAIIRTINRSTAQGEVTFRIEWMTRPQGFFGTEFVSCGFGLLAYVDNSQYVSDPVMRKIIEIAGGCRSNTPDPVIVKPELAESQAFTLAGLSGMLAMNLYRNHAGSSNK